MLAAAMARRHWNLRDVAWRSTPWTVRLFFAKPFARAHVRRDFESSSTALTCATSGCRVRWSGAGRVRVP